MMTATRVLTGNGYAGKTKGYRQVVYSPKGEIRPVARVTIKGVCVEHGTLQQAYEGDILVRCSWYPETHELFRLHSGVWEPMDETGFVRYRHILNGMSDVLKEFLQPVERQVSSFLPAGCGWDGVTTQANQAKEARIREFFKGLPESEIVKISIPALRSTFKGLPTDWKTPSPMPSHLEGVWTGEDETEFVLWYEDGRVELLPVARADSIPLPYGVVKVARIERNCYYRDGGNGKPFGIRWTLYQ